LTSKCRAHSDALGLMAAGIGRVWLHHGAPFSVHLLR
jgi:hypothetical protein